MIGPYGTAHGELYLFREAGLLTARSDLPTSLIWVIMTRTIIICEEHHLFVWNLWRMKLDLYATMSFAYGLCNLLDYHQNCLKGIKKMSRGFLSHICDQRFSMLYSLPDLQQLRRAVARDQGAQVGHCGQSGVCPSGNNDPLDLWNLPTQWIMGAWPCHSQ